MWPARRRRGELLGGASGAELIAAADGFMRAQGIASPERVDGHVRAAAVTGGQSVKFSVQLLLVGSP